MKSTIDVLQTPEHTKIASEMLHGMGGRALNAAGESHNNTSFDSHDLESLQERYTQDPKNSLAKAREALLSIAHDTTLSPPEKQAKLGVYLDAYFDVTVELDHLAYPSTPEGKVMGGVPDYIPDGFIDMGKDDSIDPSKREREQILVDKRAILEKYKPILMEVLGNDYEGISRQGKKKRMVTGVARELYRTMKYDAQAASAMGGDKVKLSEVPEGVCRHQGLVFQVLCQTIGIKSRVLKAYRDGERHSTNMVRFDDEWYIFDVTAPDYEKTAEGQLMWKPGVYPVDGPPLPNKTKRYDVKGKFSGENHIYNAHDNMHWRIDTSNS